MIPRLTLTLLAALSLSQAADLVSVTYSPDITVMLNQRTVVDHEVVRQNANGFRRRLIAGVRNDVDAFHRFPDGSALFSLEIATVANGRFARPGDILSAGPNGVEAVLDSRSLGVPEGVNADAVSVLPGGNNLLVSFDVTVQLNGNTFADEDVAQFDGQSFQGFFDASEFGVDEALDLNGLHAAEDYLLISFDGSGRVGNVDFDDEDVLEFNIASRSWSLEYDGSQQFAGWRPGDLDALYAVSRGAPEPPPPPPPPPPPTAVPGDFDGDDDVDQADFQLLSQAVGTCSGDQGYLPAADFDGNNCVDAQDSDLWFDIFVQFLIRQVLSNGVLQ